MKVIGITGGIGAGKSTILDYLAKYHQARVLQADEVGHFLTWPGRACYDKVIAAFGTDILKENKTIDRAKLADIVFNDKEKLTKLNGIIHPAVKNYIKKEIEYEKKEDRRYFVIEAALLIEDEYKALCDEIWYIYVDEEARMSRLLMERGYSVTKCRSIFNNQLSEDEFRNNCDFEIDNSKDVALAHLQIERRIKDYETL